MKREKCPCLTVSVNIVNAGVEREKVPQRSCGVTERRSHKVEFWSSCEQVKFRENDVSLSQSCFSAVY